MVERKFHAANRERLDRPERAKEYDMPGIIAELGIGRGMVVADIGAGTGFFSLPFSQAIGKHGKILAIDVSSEMLESIEVKIVENGIANIEIVLSSEERIPVADSIADIAFMSNVFHELDGDATIHEIMRILKPDGRLAILDWKKKREARGPPYHHRLSRKAVIARCEKIGFEHIGEFDTGSASIYGALFRKR